MASEIASGKEYDESCDLWNCGVIMYLLLNGQPPFHEKTREETIKAIINNPIDLTGKE
jgi:calcium-dependent protein kinase